MAVTTLGKKVGALVTTLAVVCAAASPAPIPAVAQEQEEQQVLPTGEYGTDDYERGLGDISTGETKLYLMKDQYANVGHEGSYIDKGQISVTIPVGIHFTVMRDNWVMGPADGNVTFKNRMSTSDVHVSGISVQEANGANLLKESVLAADNNYPHDSMYIRMRPDPGHLDADNKIVVDGTGTNDEFGAYVGIESKSPAHKHDWDIPAGKLLALDNLNGGCKDGVIFDELDPASETQIGSVRWTVRLGTRAEADAHDASVTLRFHANGGTVISGQPLQDLVIPVLDAEALPEIEEIDIEDVDVEGIDTEGLESVSEIELPDAFGKLAWRVVDGGFKVVDHRFDLWGFDNEAEDAVFTLEDLAECAGYDSVTDLAGKTFTLYAHYRTTSG